MGGKQTYPSARRRSVHSTGCITHLLLGICCPRDSNITFIDKLVGLLQRGGQRFVADSGREREAYVCIFKVHVGVEAEVGVSCERRQGGLTYLASPASSP